MFCLKINKFEISLFVAWQDENRQRKIVVLTRGKKDKRIVSMKLNFFTQIQLSSYHVNETLEFYGLLV